MMRITTLRANVPPPPNTSPGAALAAFKEFAAAVNGVDGVSNLTWGFGNCGIITVGASTNYAVADAILKDPRVQAAGAKILALGIGIAEDIFVTAPEQVMPFLPQQ